MTMTARWTGRCGMCGEQISVGDQIEWAKGQGAKHANCDAGYGRVATRQREAKRAAAAAAAKAS